MRFVYIDDSKSDDKSVFAALSIPADRWREAKQHIDNFRHELRDSDGIFIRKEFHATDFVRGKGRLAPSTVIKHRRAEIFRETLQMIAGLPEARLMVAVGPKKWEHWALERLLTRIDTAAERTWRSEAMIICDEGQEEEFIRLQRRIGTYNPIQSQYGRWDNGLAWKNIPVHRIVEDPVFRRSSDSWFVQAVDFCAYAFLRKEEPTAHILRYDLHTAFDLLDPILVKEACKNDPQGIIRVNAPKPRPSSPSTPTGTRAYNPAGTSFYIQDHATGTR